MDFYHIRVSIRWKMFLPLLHGYFSTDTYPSPYLHPTSILHGTSSDTHVPDMACTCLGPDSKHGWKWFGMAMLCQTQLRYEKVTFLPFFVLKSFLSFLGPSQFIPRTCIKIYPSYSLFKSPVPEKLDYWKINFTCNQFL